MALTIATINDFLSALFQPGDLIEVKGLGKQPSAGLFDDFAEAAKAARLLDSHGYNVYLTSNPIDPTSEYARFAKLNQLRVETRQMAKDADITTRRYYMLDIDPVRPSGVSATESEIEAATEVLKRVLRELKAAMLPKPVIIFSGNGFHLLLRAECIPADGSVYRHVLRHLDDVCSTPGAKVDTAVYDLKRGIRMPFTVNRKGTHTEERPHREAELLRFPEPFQVATNELMHNFAREQGYVDHLRGNLARTSSGVYQLDTDEEEVQSFVEEYLDPAGVTRNGEITYFRLAECPFAGRAHEDQLKGRGKTLIMYTGDKLQFICLAGSCQGYHWKELRELLEQREGKKLAYQFYSRIDDADEEQAFAEALTKWGCEVDVLETDQIPDANEQMKYGDDVGGWMFVPSYHFTSRWEKEVPDFAPLDFPDLIGPFQEIARQEYIRLHPDARPGFHLLMTEIIEECDIREMARYLGSELIEELKYRCCNDRTTIPEFAIREQSESIASRWQERPVPPLHDLTTDDLQKAFVQKAKSVDASLNDYHARIVHQALMSRVLIEHSVEDMARFLGHRAVAEIAELGAVGINLPPETPSYQEEDIVLTSVRPGTKSASVSTKKLR